MKSLPDGASLVARSIRHEAERIALFEWVQEQHGDLNVLVNNAGIQQWMDIADSDFYLRAKDGFLMRSVLRIRFLIWQLGIHFRIKFRGLESLEV